MIKTKNEFIKQIFTYITHDNVDGVLCLGGCSNKIPPEFWCYRTTVSSRNNFDVDYVRVQRNLIKFNAVRVTLIA